MKQIIIAALAFTISTNAFAQQQRTKTSVVVETLAFEPLQVTIETIGTAEAQKSVVLYPATADRVTEVLFEPGDFVKEGDVLITLDARRQIAALERAKIELADKQRDLQRLVKSRVNGAVTESEIDEAKALVDLAGVSLAEAQADLEDRQLVAPFSGYLGLTEIEVGDRVNQSTVITTIDDRAKLFVNFSVPEASYELVNNNTQVTVQPWNKRGQVLSASLAQLDSRIDAANRTLKVRALLDNSDDQYRPGLSFKVQLSADGELYPVIPEAALAWGATGSYIWLEQNGQAVKKSVQIKQRLRGSILVEGELTEGDSLIVEGIQRLREGSPVSSVSMYANKNEGQ